MDFKLLVAVFCLASIRVSEAALGWSTAMGTATITECVTSGTTVAVTQTALGETTAPVTYALTRQTPDSNPKKFEVAPTTGVLTTLTNFATTPGYILVITASDSTASPNQETATLTLAVTIPARCSSASFVFPSLAVMLISLFSLLRKNNN